MISIVSFVTFILIATIAVTNFASHTRRYSNYPDVINNFEDQNTSNQLRRRLVESQQMPIICQVKQVAIELDPTLNLTSHTESTWHCIQNVTEDAYELKNLPGRFMKRYGKILSLGNTWLRLEGGDVTESEAKLSISPKTSLRVVNPISSVVKSLPFQRDTKAIAGRKRVLIARVSALGSAASLSKEELSDSVFGTNGDFRNLKSQYEACSYGQLQITPAKGFQISDGVIDVNLPFPVFMVPVPYVQNAVTTALRMKLGPLIPRFDHIMLCLPPSTFGNWIAYGYINGRVSVYRDEWCSYVSSQMHEVGHNLGLDHSSLDRNEYGDTTGMMGFSYEEDNFPGKCFNAAKSWRLGWYSDRHKVIDASTLGSWSGKLVGIASYDEPAVRSASDLTVILKIRSSVIPTCDVFLMLNEKKGINWDTSQFPNAVTVVRGKAGGKSSLLEGLGSGEKLELDGIGYGEKIVIEVCSIVSADYLSQTPMYADVSIYKDDGFHSSACTEDRNRLVSSRSQNEDVTGETNYSPQEEPSNIFEHGSA